MKNRIVSKAVQERRGLWFRRAAGPAALAVFLSAGTAGWALRPDRDAGVPAARAPAIGAPRAPTPTQRELAGKAEAEGVDITWRADLGVPRTIRGRNLGARRSFSAGRGLALSAVARPEARAVAVLDNLSGLLGIHDAAREFTARPAAADGLGLRHVRADQQHAGLKVFGGQLLVHFDGNGEAYLVNGRYVPDIEVAIAPELTAADAVERAQADLAAHGLAPSAVLREPELQIFAYQAAPRLAYALTLTAEPRALNAWRFWIDARDGSVLLRYNDIKAADATITGAILEGEGGTTHDVPGWFEDPDYLLANASNRWVVYNISTDSGLYSDADSIAWRTNSFWDPEDRVEMSAGFNFNAVQQYYRNVHGRDSYDGLGTIVTANVHFGTAYVNAFWDGSTMTFGDGDGVEADPLAVLDVFGHEYQHAVTEYTADLVYAYESGALNESFSDIFGAAVEFHAQPDGRSAYPGSMPGYADWLMGEDCWKSTPALRDMRCPYNTNTVGVGNELPSRYKGTYWYSGSWDNGGVHINMGVMSFYFYLLSEGGSGVNDGLVYDVTGIGVSNAAQLAYRTLSVYCTPYTDFSDIRDAWIASALDLNPGWVSAVTSAWEAVGYSRDLPADLGETLNAPYLDWLSGGDQPWFAQGLITNTDPAAAQSGRISDGGVSRLTTTVTGPGTLSFWWKVWSEPGWDFLTFKLDSVAQASISGSQNWAKRTVSIGAGDHVLQWSYAKDDYVSNGLDAGWLDQVSWAPVWTPGVPALTVSAGAFSDRVRVTWPAMAGATGYRLFRSQSAEFSAASHLASVTAGLYDDRSAVPGVTYYYWMQGINCATYAPWTATSSGYRALAAPAGVSASSGLYVNGVKLAWRAAPGAISYRVLRHTAPDPAPARVLGETGALAWTDAAAQPGVRYYYWVVSRKWVQGGNVLSSAPSAPAPGWRRSMAAADNAPCDFDGDGRADPAVYHRAGGTWRILMSASGYQPAVFQLGGGGFQAAPRDFDGDGRTDVAVFAPASGQWSALLSGSGDALATAILGGPGGVARPGDLDGDGRADPVVFYPGSGWWEGLFSGQRYAPVEGPLGQVGDRACPADFDGDGRTDPTVFRLQTMVLGRLGVWSARLSGSGYASDIWNRGDGGQPVPQDYDGDGTADTALYHPEGGLFSCWPSSMRLTLPVTLALGGPGFTAVFGDYDGDRKADPAVYQESSGTWIVALSAGGYAKVSLQLGGPGYQPVSALP